MSSLNMTNIDEITMRLVHYFVTKENYQPILVNGLENEIWLENIDKKYGVIRINSNYIHNNEQLSFDIYKAKTIVKQIKKKTLSLSCDTLSILLNVGENVSIKNDEKHIDILTISNIDELENGESISSLFPEIKNDVIEANDDMDFFINVTNDINTKTEEKNRIYEKTFRKKRIVITYALIAINIIVFILSYVLGIIDTSDFSMNIADVRNGEFWRLITSAFFHGGIIHLVCNMYSLYVLGTQLETFMGKWKYTVVYFLSALTSSLLSGVLNGPGVASVGASGAIFGLLGAMLYFGYHYRLYLGSVMAERIIPIILLNLFIGFTMPYIDNFAHIGGLVGGLFASMMVGIEGKTNKSDTINGAIVTVILFAFLIYMTFFR